MSGERGSEEASASIGQVFAKDFVSRKSSVDDYPHEVNLLIRHLGRWVDRRYMSDPAFRTKLDSFRAFLAESDQLQQTTQELKGAEREGKELLAQQEELKTILSNPEEKFFKEATTPGQARYAALARLFAAVTGGDLPSFAKRGELTSLQCAIDQNRAKQNETRASLEEKEEKLSPKRPAAASFERSELLESYSSTVTDNLELSFAFGVVFSDFRGRFMDKLSRKLKHDPGVAVIKSIVDYALETKDEDLQDLMAICGVNISQTQDGNMILEKVTRLVKQNNEESDDFKEGLGDFVLKALNQRWKKTKARQLQFQSPGVGNKTSNI